MRLMAGVFVLQILSACGQPTEISDTQSLVLASPSSKWPSPQAIPVCIMNRDEIGDQLYADVKNFVTNDYASKTGIRFMGWEACTDSQKKSSVVRVQFNRTHNWASHSTVVAGGGLSMVGRSAVSCGADCAGGTMRLDIGADGEYPAVDSPYRSFVTNRTRATAVHEFGHAIGLMHEHERTDVVNCDRNTGRVQAQPPYVYVGKYDSDSIMNYCHSDSITTLSAGDVAGILYLYPKLSPAH